MNLGNAILANLMALTSGAVIVLALSRYPVTAAAAGLIVGLGYVLGCGLAALALWVAIRLGLTEPVLAAAVALTGVTTLAAWVYLRRPRRGPDLRAPSMNLSSGLLWGGLLGLLALNAGLLLLEAQSHPIYPWDAWSAWSVKARVWAELGPDIDFVSPQQWLGAEAGTVYTNAAWNYPELLPLIQFWTVGWGRAWDERLALLPWGLLYPAMLAASYSGLRLLRTERPAAMLVTYLIGAIPILGVQIALAGYADVWLAAELLLFAICAILILEGGPRGLVGAALALLAMACATKLEGSVWALVGIAAITLGLLPARARRWTLALAAGLVAAWLLAGGIELALPGGTRIVITPQRIELPYLGAYELSFTNRLDVFVRAFLVLPNWHFVWYLLLPAGLWLAWDARAASLGRALGAYLGLGLGFLFVLFFMTPAGQWAESMTASNRLALQFVPAALFWVGLLAIRRVDRSRYARTSA